jgi:TolB-like protein
MKKLLFLCLLFSQTVWAQSNGTMLIGKVVDENNEGLVDVKIELHNKPIPARTSKGSQGAFEIPTLNMPIEKRIFLKVEKKGYWLPNAFEGNLFEVSPEMRKEGFVSIKMAKVPQLNEKPRIALLPFCNFGEPDKNLLVRAFVAPIRRGLSEIDTAKMQLIPYSLVEKAMNQYQISPQDYCNQAKIIAFGNDLKANIVITGAYQFIDSRLQVDCEFTDIYRQTDFREFPNPKTNSLPYRTALLRKLSEDLASKPPKKNENW